MAEPSWLRLRLLAVCVLGPTVRTAVLDIRNGIRGQRGAAGQPQRVAAECCRSWAWLCMCCWLPTAVPRYGVRFRDFRG